MVIAGSPDIFQEASLDDHLDHLQLGLITLRYVDLKINASKSKCCAIETEYLGIKCKPTSVKNPQANAILEQVHQVTTTTLPTSKLHMTNAVETSDIDAFLIDAVWAICSTYHTVLKASPGHFLPS